MLLCVVPALPRFDPISRSFKYDPHPPKALNLRYLQVVKKKKKVFGTVLVVTIIAMLLYWFCMLSV